MKTDCPMQCDGTHCICCAFAIFVGREPKKEQQTNTTYIPPDDKQRSNKED